MHWTTIIGFILFIIASLLTFYGARKDSDSDNEKLKIEINKKNETLDSLFKTNTIILNINQELKTTVERYYSEIELKNKKIENLKIEVQKVRDYSYFATFDFKGNNILVSNQHEKAYLTITTELYLLMHQILIFEDEKSAFSNFKIKQDNKTLVLINTVINRYPNYPFGYYVKYLWLKSNNQKSWIDFAKQAKSIFEVTTKISGHSIDHDDALKIIRIDLSKINY